MNKKRNSSVHMRKHMQAQIRYYIYKFEQRSYSEILKPSAIPTFKPEPESFLGGCQCSIKKTPNRIAKKFDSVHDSNGVIFLLEIV